MSEKIIVTVNEGRVRGTKKKSAFSGVEYYAFFGVPYGQPTTGRARFKDPVKVKPWKNIFDATIEKEGCSQFALQMQRLAGTEDCLYNNIYTPNISDNGDLLKPVIINIHPGGFFHGSPEPSYHGSPEYIMHRDVVYVCIAYRLHILGFLNLDLDECSGNQGLKDIVLGLKWVKDNIRNFGGDPNNITLLGSSSGSAIVHTLLLSPYAKGLYHKAIIMGMYAFSPTLVLKGEHKKEALEIAHALGHVNDGKCEGKKLLNFYQKPLLNQIINFRPEVIYSKQTATIFPCSPFLPTLDQGKSAMFPKPFNELIDTMARVPLMFGICKREAVMGFTKPYRKSTMEKFYKSYRQNRFSWGNNVTDDEVEQIKKKIDSFYLKESSIHTAPLSVKVDIQTDISFSNVYDTLINVVSSDLPSSVFIYKFEFDGNVCTMKDLVGRHINEPLDGTYHAADFSYWACINDPRGGKTDSLTPKSREMVETFTKLITTFARTGNPNYESLNIQWKPTTPEKPCYLSINDTLNMVEGKLNGERMEFWEGIIKQYKKA